MSRNRVGKFYPTEEETWRAAALYIRDNSCIIELYNTRLRRAYLFDGTEVGFYRLSNERDWLNIAGVELAYAEFHGDIDDRSKRYVISRVRGGFHD